MARIRPPPPLTPPHGSAYDYGTGKARRSGRADGAEEES
jgi:hypothetical protein